MTAGIRAHNLEAAQILDSVLGIAAGSARQLPLDRLAAQVSARVGPTYATLAALQADLAWPAGALGTVYADPAPALNGQYRKQEITGAGSWARIGDGALNPLAAQAQTAAAQAQAAQTQAALAAQAAGAPFYATQAAGLAGTVDQALFLVPQDPGIRIYRNDAGTATALGWLGDLAFSTVTALLASTAPDIPAGTVLRTRRDGHTYVVADPGALDHHLTTAGGAKLYVEKGPAGYNIAAFGAKGDGATNDSAAFAMALGLGRPVYVPWTATHYNVSGLSTAQTKLLYGPGAVELDGTALYLSTASAFRRHDRAVDIVVNDHMQPAQWAGVQGALRSSLRLTMGRRDGGFGSYGADMVDYSVDTPTPSGQFDVARTTWLNHSNMTGGNAFGGWYGANSPNSGLGHIWTGGGVVGMEINTGNCWAELGLQEDIGPMTLTGAQVAPDVLPSRYGVAPGVFHGSFALAVVPSIHGHKWWTGYFNRPDAVAPGGRIMALNGGYDAARAAGVGIRLAHHMTRGLDLSSANFGDHALLLGGGQTISWGGTQMAGTATTFGLSLAPGSGEGSFFTHGYARSAFRWSDNGSQSQLGLFGKAPVPQPQNVAVTVEALHAALVAIGAITGP